MVIFKRFPKLFWRLNSPDSITPSSVRNQYPALAEDFLFLEQELIPYYWQLGHEALKRQNQFIREQVILILGTSIATILGILQFALGYPIGVGVVQAILAGLVAALALEIQLVKAKARAHGASLKAATLRGEYFRYLGQVGTYDDSHQRKQRLIQRVADIRNWKD